LVPEFVMELKNGRHNRIYPETVIQKNFASKYKNILGYYRSPSIRERGHSVQQNQWRWLENGHLTKRMEAWAINGARKGITYTYPLLDKRIVEFGLGIPADQFVQQGWKRSIMRRAIGGLVPEEIQWNRTKDEPTAINTIVIALKEALPIILKTITNEYTNDQLKQLLDIRKLKDKISDPKLEEVEYLLQCMAMAHAALQIKHHFVEVD